MPKEQKCISLEHNKNNIRRNDNHGSLISKSSSTLNIKKNNEVKSQPRKLKDLKKVSYKLTQRIVDEDPKKVTIKSNIYSKNHKHQPKIKVTFSFQTYNPTSKKEWSRGNTASHCNLGQKHISKKQDISFLSAKNPHMIGDSTFKSIIRQSSKVKPNKESILKILPNTSSSKSTEFMKISKSCSNQYHTINSKTDTKQLKKRNLENNKFHYQENKYSTDYSTSQKLLSRPKYELSLNTFICESNELHTVFFSKDFCVTGKKLTFWKKMKLHLDTLRPSQVKCNENHDGKPILNNVKNKNNYNITPTNDCDVNYCFTKNKYARSIHDIKKDKTPTYEQPRHYTHTPASNCGQFKVIQFPHDYSRSERSKDKTVSLKYKLCQCKKLKILSERLTKCSCESYPNKRKGSKCIDVNIKDGGDPGHEKGKTSDIQSTSDTLLKRTKVEQWNNGVCIKVLNVDGNLTDGKNGLTIKKPCARSRDAKTQYDYNHKQNQCRIRLFKNRITCSRRILNKMSADISTNKPSQSNAEQRIEGNIGDTNQIQYSHYTVSASPKSPRKIKSCPCNRVSDKPNKLILVSPERIKFEVKKDGKCLKILNYNNVKMFKCSKHHENNCAACKKKINRKRDNLLGSSVMIQCVHYNNKYRKLISAVFKSLVKRKKICTRNRIIKTNQEEIPSNSLYSRSNTHLFKKRKSILNTNEKCKSCLKSRLVLWYKDFKDMSSSILKEFKREISLKRIRSKLPDFKAKEVYRMTLSRRPCFIIYNLFPWIYPHFLYFVKLSKQMFQIFLFMFAALIWCPCFLVLECSRFWLCHFC